MILHIICFSANHAALRTKIKYWLAWNQDNVSEWSDMSTGELLFQSTSTIQIQLSVLVLYKVDIIIISTNVTCSSHDITGWLNELGSWNT